MEVAKVDRDMDIVDRLRLGGPNALEVVDQAADEIERLRGAIDIAIATLERIVSTRGVESGSAT